MTPASANDGWSAALEFSALDSVALQVCSRLRSAGVVCSYGLHQLHSSRMNAFAPVHSSSALLSRSGSASGSQPQPALQSAGSTQGGRKTLRSRTLMRNGTPKNRNVGRLDVGRLDGSSEASLQQQLRESTNTDLDSYAEECILAGVIILIRVKLDVLKEYDDSFAVGAVHKFDINVIHQV